MLIDLISNDMATITPPSHENQSFPLVRKYLISRTVQAEARQRLTLPPNRFR